MKTAQLHVAHLVPYSITFPLKSHNGRYDWLLDLATRQAASGITVTIYSNPASYIDIPGITWKSLAGEFADATTANRALLLNALQNPEIDIFHSHFDNLHYTVADATAKPIVFTQHWWPSDETVSRAQAYRGDLVWAVPPTQYMLDFDHQNDIQTKGHIYHGINLQKFQNLNKDRSNRLLFVGRISPEKNLPVAIAAAKLAGLPLDIIGKVAPKNQAYWQELSPTIDGDQIRYLGQKSAAELVDYYNAARAVIFPSSINEPFGLVAIEAQACGAPILMQRGGSRAELLQDGITGYLCDNEAGFAAAAKKATGLNPNNCVKFAKKFDVNAMLAAYSRLYQSLVV